MTSAPAKVRAIQEKLDAAIRERERCLGLLGERLGMMAKLREQNRIIERLTASLERAAACGTESK